MWESKSFLSKWGVLLIFFSTLLESSAVDKPLGVFASSGASGEAIYENPQLRGALVRTSWSDLEASPGSFNFASIDGQANQVKAQGLPWSLAVNAGGLGTPDWLLDQLNAPYFSYSFRGEAGYRLPLIWDPVVQLRMKLLAEALAERYGNDPLLQLVYVPQMTSNGIEGHLQGVDMSGFALAGYTDERWVTASIANARNFALAFEQKALAFEVHDINGGSEVPMSIVESLWQDEELAQRVGAAVWWLSGKTSYQPDLLAALADFPGDIYAQLIGNSGQADRFAEENIANAFQQGKALGVRYIEPWEYEFKYTALSANGAWDALLADFNTWANLEFASVSLPLDLAITETHLVLSGEWLAEDDLLQSSPDLQQWLPVEEAIYQNLPPAFLIERSSESFPTAQFYRVQPN